MKKINHLVLSLVMLSNNLSFSSGECKPTEDETKFIESCGNYSSIDNPYKFAFKFSLVTAGVLGLTQMMGPGLKGFMGHDVKDAVKNIAMTSGAVGFIALLKAKSSSPQAVIGRMQDDLDTYFEPTVRKHESCIETGQYKDRKSLSIITSCGKGIERSIGRILNTADVSKNPELIEMQKDVKQKAISIYRESIELNRMINDYCQELASLDSQRDTCFGILQESLRRAKISSKK